MIGRRGHELVQPTTVCDQKEVALQIVQPELPGSESGPEQGVFIIHIPTVGIPFPSSSATRATITRPRVRLRGESLATADICEDIPDALAPRNGLIHQQLRFESSCQHSAQRHHSAVLAAAHIQLPTPSP
eukprot:CAMPEP_0175046050 /NCGR_PEP_ID=MMETSP0052_2-20121109/4807_1 /TAXON_ID=51329 ORGANISM="Polytomella parva, Strain SAG 63-3" /NCGR_SAMPLE_ID=MMETSP0052_2 /ASSEMBLY_ACC=CAM_ASM_000194 /LENGTH=129 /DNA_ID=CAMNT_0016309737 /DNA_START=2124 /DNA_END=2513 /DNA_ORIENTATION=-